MSKVRYIQYRALWQRITWDHTLCYSITKSIITEFYCILMPLCCFTWSREVFYIPFGKKQHFFVVIIAILGLY